MSISQIIAIGGSASSGSGASSSNEFWAIGDSLAQLIANGSNAFQVAGASILNLNAGSLSMASTAQIGRVIDGLTITADMVAQNQSFLNALGAYCRANNIEIHVEAQLDNPPQGDWTYQWLVPAQLAGLPITSVENDNEVVSYVSAQRAQYEVAIVKQIAAVYPNVKIGQWDTKTDAPLSASLEWWNTYNTAATAAGLPTISYVVADTPWNAPWVFSQADWENWLKGLSQLTASNGLQLEVLLDGISSDASSQQWTAQSEQHAAMLATLLGPAVSTLLVKSWSNVAPTAVLPVNSPTTTANDAAVIGATYPLYAAGLITGTVRPTLGGPPQASVQTGSNAALPILWSNQLGSATDHYAVVILSGTGLLSARSFGNGTVSGSGTTRLVLNGTGAELASELASLSVNETLAGADMLDLEVFGKYGRLLDQQLSVFSLQNPLISGSVEIAAGSAAQGWTTASLTTNASGLVTSETLTWNTSGFDRSTGQTSITKTLSIHQPIAQSGLIVVDGKARDPSASPAKGSTTSLPIGTTMNVSAKDPSWVTQELNVIQSTFTYSGTSGRLLTETDTVAPFNATVLLPQGSFVNYMADGGTQVTQYNTGDNPGWKAAWNPTLGFVTTTYGSAGQIIEQVFQGGVNDPYLTVDNIFNPYSGLLWEQIISAPPPAGYDTFVTGTKYVTQYNTGDNPNWNWTDWGNAAQITVVWNDWKVVGVLTTAPIPTGLTDTFAYSLSSTTSVGTDGTVLVAGAGVGGSTLIGANQSTTLTGYGHDVFYARLGPTKIVTGGSSQVFLSGANTTSVNITSRGADTIWATQARAAVANLGTTADVVHVQGGTVTLTGTAGTIIADAGAGSTIVAAGVGYNVDLRGTGDIATLGDNATVSFDGSAAVVGAGSNVSANFWNSGNTLNAQDGAHVWLTAGNNVSNLGARSMLDQVGDHNLGRVGDGSTVFQFGTGNAVTAGSDCKINQYGTSGSVVAGNRTSLWLAGSGASVTAGDFATANIIGRSNALVLGTNAKIEFNCTGAQVQTGANAIVNMWYDGNSLKAGDGSQAWLTSGHNIATLGARSMLDQVGNDNVGSVGDGSIAFQFGLGNRVNTGSDCKVNQYGLNGTVVAGDGCTLWVAGSAGNVTAGAYAQTDVIGQGNTITVSDHAKVGISGTGTVLSAGSVANVKVSSSGNTLWVGDRSLVTLISAGNVATVGAGSLLDQTGAANSGTIGDNSVVYQRGADDLVHAGAYCSIIQSGSRDVATCGDHATLLLSGTYGTVTGGTDAKATVAGSGQAVLLSDRASVKITGSACAVTLGRNAVVDMSGTGGSLKADADAVVHVWAANNTVLANDRAQVWLTSGGNNVTLGAASMLDQVGASNTGVVGDRSIVFQYGIGGDVKAGANCQIQQYAASNTATCGDNSSLWLASTQGTVTAGANAIATLPGSNNKLTVGSSATVKLVGNSNTVFLGSSGICFISGSNETIGISASGGSQTINGFSLAKHDVLELSKLCAGTSLRQDLSNIDKFVQVSARGSDILLSVSGKSATSLVTLVGGSGITLSSLVGNHAIAFAPQSQF